MLCVGFQCYNVKVYRQTLSRNFYIEIEKKENEMYISKFIFLPMLLIL